MKKSLAMKTFALALVMLACSSLAACGGATEGSPAPAEDWNDDAQEAELAGLTVRIRALPPAVLAAVVENHQVGRGDMDMGGVSHVFAYDIGKGSERLVPAIVSALTRFDATAKREERDLSIQAACRGARQRTASACSRWVLGQRSEVTSNNDDALAWMKMMRADKDLDKTFTTPLGVIDDFARAEAGRRPRVLKVRVPGVPNVDVVTTILLNEDLTRAVVITYDFGA